MKYLTIVGRGIEGLVFLALLYLLIFQDDISSGVVALMMVLGRLGFHLHEHLYRIERKLDARNHKFGSHPAAYQPYGGHTG